MTHPSLVMPGTSPAMTNWKFMPRSVANRCAPLP